MTSASATALPFFLGHGEQDAVVMCSAGQWAAEFVTSELGIPKAGPESPIGVQWEQYPDLKHSMSAKEFADMGAWLSRVLPAGH